MIIFVGDKPSAKNVDTTVPFVGTQSYKRLLEWIWEMDLSINEIKMYNKDFIETRKVKYNTTQIYPIDCKFIALGNNAERVLQNQKLNYFKLPHPSPRNRKLNNKKYIKEQLKLCKEWLND